MSSVQSSLHTGPPRSHPADVAGAARPDLRDLLVLLAEDDQHARSALRVLLDQETAVRVVGEAATSAELIQAVEQTQPHLVVLDWELPDLDACELLQWVRSRSPGVVVVALSIRPETSRVAIAQGADAFVWKGDAPDHLLGLVRQAAERAATPVPEPAEPRR